MFIYTFYYLVRLKLIKKYVYNVYAMYFILSVIIKRSINS